MGSELSWVRQNLIQSDFDRVAKYCKSHIDLLKSEDYTTLYKGLSDLDTWIIKYLMCLGGKEEALLFGSNEMPVGFLQGTNLKDLFMLPKDVKLSERCFADTTGITRFICSTTEKEVPCKAFMGSSISKFELPASGQITTIGDQAFEGSALSEYVVPIAQKYKVEHIGKRAFAKCENLTIFDGGLSALQKIDNDAFASCHNLDSIVLPRNAVKIEGDAFYDTPNLVTFICGPAVPDFHGCDFATAPELRVFSYRGTIEAFVISMKKQKKNKGDFDRILAGSNITLFNVLNDDYVNYTCKPEDVRNGFDKYE